MGDSNVIVCYREDRYMRSADALYDLTNRERPPNLAVVLEPEEEMGEVLVRWEKPDGRPLRELIQERRRERGGHAFTEAEALAIVLQVAQALAHLHRHDIVHRDVRPENIYVTTAEGHAVLAGFYQFGILTDAEVRGITDHGYDLYRPPEVLNDDNPVWYYTSDVWCLGCVLYEMIMPEHPFKGATVMSTIKNVQRGRVNAETPVDKYSQQMRTILHQMLWIDPAERSTAAAVVAFCNEHREGSDGAPAAMQVDPDGAM